MAWSIGANDVANSMSTSVGAKAITHKQAVIIAGVLVFLGAVLVGPHVAETIKSEIINVENIQSNLLILGFISALLAAAIWSTLSTWKEMPISTTHSIIGALMGFGLIAGGTGSVNWLKIGSVAASWALSPFFGCILAFLVFKIIVRLIFAKEEPVGSAKIVGPIIIGITGFLVVISFLLKTPISKNYNISDFQAVVISLVVAIMIGIVSIFLLRKIQAKKEEDYLTVENIFRKLQIGTACYVAFSIGANDVANAIGPVAGILPLAETGELSSAASIPFGLLALGGIGIAFGAITWGKRVMKTVGERITSLTNTRGFSVEFSAATTVLVASRLGMPISTSHTVVGAVIGVGLARGLEAVDLSIIKKIVISWLLTLPIAAGTSIGIFLLLRTIFV
ncbi:MAG: phosphate permease [Thermoplasmata archaeon M8B2D]|nr:MAG: phosphate permease [Thermoplasmata archaeon M8B2D]